MFARLMFRMVTLTAIVSVAVVLLARPLVAVELTVEETSRSPGEVITVSVLIDAANDLLAADISLRYDPKIFTVKKIKRAGLASDLVIAHVDSYGNLSVALAGWEALPGGGGALIDISLGIRENAMPGNTDIAITEATVYDAAYEPIDIKTSDVTVMIGAGLTMPWIPLLLLDD